MCPGSKPGPAALLFVTNSTTFLDMIGLWSHIRGQVEVPAQVLDLGIRLHSY
jgi:hypothetical protein